MYIVSLFDDAHRVTALLLTLCACLLVFTVAPLPYDVYLLRAEYGAADDLDGAHVTARFGIWGYCTAETSTTTARSIRCSPLGVGYDATALDLGGAQQQQQTTPTPNPDDDDDDNDAYHHDPAILSSLSSSSSSGPSSPSQSHRGYYYDPARASRFETGAANVMGLGAAALAVAAVPCYALARRSPSRAAYMAVLGAELASGVVFTLAFFFQSGLASRLADGALTAGAAPTATRLGPGMYAGMAALAAQLAALTSCFYVTIGGAERYNNQHHQHHHRQQEEGAVRCIGPRSPLPYARSPRLDGGEQSPLMVVMMEDRETGTLCEKKEESVRDGELV